MPPSPATTSRARRAPRRSSIPATRRYSRAPGVLSFVGFVPADDPRLTMLVHARRAEEREVGQRGGRAHLRRIGREALRYLNVPPRDTAPVADRARRDRRRGAVHAPAAPPRSASTARPSSRSSRRRRVGDAHAAGRRGCRSARRWRRWPPSTSALEVSGRGVVVSQAPPPGAPLAGAAPLCRLALASPAARP